MKTSRQTGRCEHKPSASADHSPARAGPLQLRRRVDRPAVIEGRGRRSERRGLKVDQADTLELGVVGDVAEGNVTVHDAVAREVLAQLRTVETKGELSCTAKTTRKDTQHTESSLVA